MATKKKLLQAAAGSAGGAGGLDIPDVFSTYLYSGNSSAQTITNGIDLDGEGGLWWLKRRTGAGSHALYDSTRATGSEHFPLFSNSNIAEYDDFDTTPTSTGFTINSTSSGTVNETGQDYVSWTWRKAPKFFDVVEYTGNNTARTISHNLGTTPGLIICKAKSGSGNWKVWHRSLSNGASGVINLNLTGAETSNTTVWNNTLPTDTVFSLGTSNQTNETGLDFVAYVFAHNDNGDGEFGPDSDQDIVKCGSYTGNGSSTGPEIDLGFEPQWLLIKKATGGAQSWAMYDTMRGITSGGDDAVLFADTTSDEFASYASLSVTSTGFKLDAPHDWVNTSGETYIYMAIRRGPLAVPEDATDVFDVETRTANEPHFKSDFDRVDFALYKSDISGTGDLYAAPRLISNKILITNSTSAEINGGTGFVMDFSGGWYGNSSASSNSYSWMWKRAPSFFDVVAYTGNGTAGHNVSHNLGVTPEMMWVKARNFSSGHWLVYHKGANGGTNPEQYYALLNDSSGFFDGTTQAWNDTAPTSSVFTLGTGNSVNSSSYNYIAYLFATLDGVSKVGSYTGNGSSQTINCGFSNGARFILIKRIDSAGTQPFDWYIWDTERGIVAGNDPHLSLNTSAAEVTSDDSIDPENSGFIVNQVSATNINASSGEYIFYAIA